MELGEQHEGGEGHLCFSMFKRGLVSVVAGTGQLVVFVALDILTGDLGLLPVSRSLYTLACVGSGSCTAYDRPVSFFRLLISLHGSAVTLRSDSARPVLSIRPFSSKFGDGLIRNSIDARFIKWER